MLPIGFTYLEDPRIILSLDYCTSHNFTGRPVAGYLAPVCILTEQAANALIAIQNELDTLQKGYHLKIFDAYRPMTAVTDFKNWAKDPKQQLNKELFYPHIPKTELFDQGYIAEKSSHSRGSTVDLTISATTGPLSKNNHTSTDLAMGAIFDFFDATSHTDAPNISDNAKQNRAFLKSIMEKHGFVNYPLEWWHFTLKNEPFPETYFDFPVR